jgi:transcriptional repressor NrdR
MHCPYCRHDDSRVIDSRVADDGSSIRRRRQCPACDRRFTTVEQTQLAVLKRSGVVEPFVRDKVIQGVRKACKGRPVSDADLARLGQQVEEAIRQSGLAEVPSEDIGLAILGPLSALDPVAYLRFASVYRHYESVDDFEEAIARLRTEQSEQSEQAEQSARSGRVPAGV